MTKDGPPLSRPFRVTRLSAKVPTTFALTADPGQRAAMAEALGILGVERMVFSGSITPVGKRDFTLQGRLAARVVQSCVVTLEPVRTELVGEVLRRFLQDYADPAGDEVELQDDTLEPLPEVIDPGVVAVEELALLLPAYPRAPGAVFEAPVDDDAADPADDAPRRPFAGLADLAARMAAKPDEPDEKG